MSKIKRLRAVLTGVVATALAVPSLTVLTTATASADVVSPTVTTTVGIAQTGLLSPASPVILTFSAAVTGVSATSLGLRDQAGGNISGQLIWPGSSPTTATFVPARPLLPGEVVSPWITDAVVDSTGSPVQVVATPAYVNPIMDSSAPTLTETWSQVSSGRASGGSYAKSAGAHDSISFAANGSKFSLIGVRSRDGGYASLSVDGVPRKTLDFYAKTPAYKVNLFTTALTAGSHVITVTVKGSHPKGSLGNAVNVDAVHVDATVLEQSAARQTWSVHRSTDAYDGSYVAQAGLPGVAHIGKATLSAGFYGAEVGIAGCKSPDGGDLAVFVDGVLSATKDTFQKFTSCDLALVAVKGLSDGPHTVVVAVLGSHNPLSTGSKVSIDFLVAL